MRGVFVFMLPPLLAAASVALAASAPAALHSYDLTYRSFGKVEAKSDFVGGEGYQLRFEGCYAKHSEEAICGFTLRATRPLTLGNSANLSHGSAADGAPVRTCCLFVQNDNRGYPITKEAAVTNGGAAIARSLQPGDMIGVMLRVPNYREPPLASITFSHGEGDAGVSFSTGVTELAGAGAP